MRRPGQVNVEDSVNSGQVFLWRRAGRSWFVVDGQRVLEIVGGDVSGAGAFFRLDDDYAGILGEISGDRVIRRLVERYGGLRLLRQDPFQCLISFIVSANSSIPNIRSALERICRRFGEREAAGRNEFWLFPGPDRLVRASQAELLACGLGYRAKFVGGAARQVADGLLELEPLRGTSYGAAKARLTRVAGIGNKVADCIMLFSLDKLEAFPLDTWVLRALDGFYPGTFSTGGSLTDRRYETLHGEAVGRFGRYAGYAQQFMFKAVRDQNQRRWQ